ncbi:hypothetical protein GOBAR_DD30324 [Gossypium barbadense]|nr:hypothetical protein GOBAR_DD30324 [Gossypium barbadense]
MKRKISAKIAICCGRAISKLFYKFPISTDPFKFCEMQLLDDDDLGTMMEIWWPTRSENPQPVESFVDTKANVREMTNNGEDSDQDVEDFSDSDVDEVPDDIDDEGPEEGDMLNVDLDAGHASEFPEYADIVPAHRLTINSQFKELFVGQQFENKTDCVFAIKQYKPVMGVVGEFELHLYRGLNSGKYEN